MEGHAGEDRRQRREIAEMKALIADLDGE